MNFTATFVTVLVFKLLLLFIKENKTTSKRTYCIKLRLENMFTYLFKINISHIQKRINVCSRNKHRRRKGRRKIKGINYTYKQKAAGKRLVFQISKRICERKRNCASASSHTRFTGFAALYH